MLGNDVIDLEDVDARPETFRPRFDERVFTAEERRVIARDAAPLACRWAHWGAKEAAYKLARQIDSHFVFSPIRLIPRYEPAEIASESSTSAATPSLQACWVERRGILSLPERLQSAGDASAAVQELEIRSYETSASVHVVALPAGADWGAMISSVEEQALFVSAPPVPAVPVPDSSRAVRVLAVREIGKSLGIDAKRLSIGRCGKIPTVELDGGRTSLSLSLSHHGRFVAFVMTPTACVQSEAEIRSGTDTRSEMILDDQIINSVSPKTASE